MNAPTTSAPKQGTPKGQDTPKQAAPQNGSTPKKSKEEWQAERADRFHRVAARRTNEAIKAMRKLARTGSKQTYYYTESEKDMILSAIRAEYHALEAAFAASSESDDKPAFSF